MEFKPYLSTTLYGQPVVAFVSCTFKPIVDLETLFVALSIFFLSTFFTFDVFSFDQFYTHQILYRVILIHRLGYISKMKQF